MTSEVSRRTLLAASALTIAAPPVARAQAADLQSLYEAAKAAGETELMVYLPAAASYKPFLDAFSRDVSRHPCRGHRHLRRRALRAARGGAGERQAAGRRRAVR